MNFSGKRVVVMGLGRFGGGVGVARFLTERGAQVLVTDLLSADELCPSIGLLADLSVEYRLGTHEISDFTSADLIVVNPAVDPAGNPYLLAAADAGVPINTEIRLLTSQLPKRCQIIGVTGTAGKSTVTAMIGHILANQHGIESVHVGGNLGGSLLNEIDNIKTTDWVVLELSSFMLQGLALDRWSPHVAVITNLSPNHLDRHGTIESYTRAKHGILDHQTPEDIAVLGPGTSELFRPRCRQVVRVSNIIQTEIYEITLPGEHNQINAALAVETARCLGVDLESSRQALQHFHGLPHRLQHVLEHQGVHFYNDSKSTTPEATQTAITSLLRPEPYGLHVILGGHDKGSDLKEMARFAAANCCAIYTIGATGDVIASVAESSAPSPISVQVHRCKTLAQAVKLACRSAGPGDVVLLSPGCASWDQFDHFEQRGDQFVSEVRSYTHGH